MVGHECTTSVVTVDSLALFPNHTSDSGSDGRGKLASGTSVRGNLVERVLVDTLHGIDFAVVSPTVQYAGQVPHPWGIDHKSAIKRLPASYFFFKLM